MIFWKNTNVKRSVYVNTILRFLFLRFYWCFHEISMFENYVGILHHHFTMNPALSAEHVKINNISERMMICVSETKNDDTLVYY